jgi:hypothetical protein
VKNTSILGLFYTFCRDLPQKSGANYLKQPENKFLVADFAMVTVTFGRVASPPAIG